MRQKIHGPSGSTGRRAKRGLWVLGLVLLACAVVAYLWLKPGPFEPRFRWMPGKAYVYSLSHAEHSAATLGQGELGEGMSFEGGATLDGELRISCYGKREGRYVLGLKPLSLSEAEVVAMGQAALGDEATTKSTLESAEVFVDMAPDGTVTSVRSEASLAPAAAGVLRSLLGWTQVSLLGEGAYEALERSTVGESSVLYTWSDRTRLAKQRRSWETLLAVPGGLEKKSVTGSGAAKIALGEEGHLRSFEGSDRWTVKNSEGQSQYTVEAAVELSLLRIENLELKTDKLAWIRALRSSNLFDVEVSASAEERSLRQRTMGMDAARVARDLAVYGDGGQMPDHARWVWRATGALKLEPEGCTELAKLFTEEGRTSSGRRFLTELLVSVGHEQAQAALRQMLSSPQGKSDPQYYDILQRLTLLEQPEIATVELVRGELKSENESVHMGAAFATGALSQKLRAQGETELASALNTQLVGMLDQAKTSDHKAGYLAALGNTGLEDNVPAIVPHASSGSADVRRAVTRALRKTQTEEAETALLELVSDKDDTVQRSALETLEGWKIETSHLDALKKKLTEGRIAERAKPNLTRLLSKELRGEDKAKAATSRRMLEHMMDGPLPTKLRYQIGGLLKGQRGQQEQAEEE